MNLINIWKRKNNLKEKGENDYGRRKENTERLFSSIKRNG